MKKYFIFLIGAMLSLCVRVASAEEAPLPFLHGLFTDNAVIQRDVRAPIWGWTTPGTTVTVEIDKVAVQATAGTDGLWVAHIGPFPAGGPKEITISGPTNVTLHNILFGDVWLCSGQSNMEMGLGVTSNGEAEINAANFPNIRLYSVGHCLSLTPTKNLVTNWFECSPDHIRQTANTVWGGFSAAAYFMGRDLHQELKVPIGLILSSWGGTMIEPWSSERAIRKVHRFDALLDTRGLTMEQWIEKYDPGTAHGLKWAATKLDDSDWNTMELPTRWETAGLPDYDGVVWFRRQVTIPKAWLHKDLLVSLGPIDDADTTWFNGVKIGETNEWTCKRRYLVPGKSVKSINNSLAVRVLDAGQGGGFFGKPDYLTISRASDTNKTESLAGSWKYKASLKVGPDMPLPIAGTPTDPSAPALIYNGMIAPLVPYAVKGFFWYQGESNAGTGPDYDALLRNLVDDLRYQFKNPHMPALIVQLPFFQPFQQQPVEDSGWVTIRQAQLDAVKADTNMGLVVTIDIGDMSNIHPPNKKDVGHRAALAALGLVYGKDVVPSGPLYRSMKKETDGIRLSFDYAGTGLKTSDGKAPRGFAIAGADGQFVFADATIKGSDVIVSSDKVPNPTAVRYAWANNPDCNIVNSADLPASPFQTDRH